MALAKQKDKKIPIICK